MPVRTSLRRHGLPDEAELRRALSDELRAPHAEGEPDIVIEQPAPGTTHLFVTWSRWDGFEQTVRARIILDAFEDARGEDEVLKVTVAMGLTPEEAARMGIG
ncbi:MAG TPA: hypothetical protein VGG39_06145 [Polyangiaceae bacterium]|jgi:hypothetical protein